MLQVELILEVYYKVQLYQLLHIEFYHVHK
jgi:hypothetical protein